MVWSDIAYLWQIYATFANFINPTLAAGANDRFTHPLTLLGAPILLKLLNNPSDIGIIAFSKNAIFFLYDPLCDILLNLNVKIHSNLSNQKDSNSGDLGSNINIRVCDKRQLTLRRQFIVLLVKAVAFYTWQ